MVGMDLTTSHIIWAKKKRVILVSVNCNLSARVVPLVTDCKICSLFCDLLVRSFRKRLHHLLMCRGCIRNVQSKLQKWCQLEKSIVYCLFWIVGLLSNDCIMLFCFAVTPLSEAVSSCDTNEGRCETDLRLSQRGALPLAAANGLRPENC